MNALERVAREARGRLVALLAKHNADLATAEDAVAEAFVAALEQWPATGIPDAPEAWLYRVAHRKLVGRWRHADVRRRKSEAIRLLENLPRPTREWPDARLPLLLVCTHPAIDSSLHAALMLQTVFGFSAEALAPTFGTTGKTLGQRLWRAKRKIREARIPFEVPQGPDREARIASVLDALYGLHARAPDEALWLAEVVVERLPEVAEAHGLLALFCYDAARAPTEAYVPLTEQDSATWDRLRIARADAALLAARALHTIGPFQLEAAIQGAMVHGHLRGTIDHGGVLVLYDALMQHAPTTGLQIGRAAALAHVHGAERAMEALDAIDGGEVQAWWAVRADLLAKLNDPRARAAYDEAIARTDDPRVQRWLASRRPATALDPVHNPKDASGSTKRQKAKTPCTPNTKKLLPGR